MRCLEPFQILNLKRAKALLIFFFFVSFLHAKIVITLQPVVNLKKSEILLKDISKISGNASQKKFIDFIENIKIKNLNKSVIKITKNEVKKRLKENYIDLKNLTINGPKRVIVKRAMKEIKEAQIINDAKRFLIKKYRNIDIIEIELNKNSIVVPVGKIAKRIYERSKSSNNIYLNYEIYVDGKKYLTLPLNARVKFVKLAPFAKRDIPKGKIIYSDDITFEKYKSNGRREFLTKEDIIGKVAKVNIKRGSLIKRYFLRPDFKVLKRKNVKIIYSKGSIQINLLGLALENGSIGDTVRVKNISTNKVIKCKVVGPWTVEYVD